MTKSWHQVTLPDGQMWRPALFELLDEEHIERDHELRPIALAVPGRPELYAYAPASLSAAAGFSNPTRGLEQLLSCSSLNRVEAWRVGSKEVVLVERPMQAAPRGGKPLVVWCGTPSVAEAGAALKAENYARMIAGKEKA